MLVAVNPQFPQGQNRELSMQTETISKGETRYLTVAQLAKRLQISESTIYGWVDRDYIPFLMREICSDSIRMRLTRGCRLKPIGKGR
jgi:hypothetical protein